MRSDCNGAKTRQPGMYYSEIGFMQWLYCVDDLGKANMRKSGDFFFFFLRTYSDTTSTSWEDSTIDQYHTKYASGEFPTFPMLYIKYKGSSTIFELMLLHNSLQNSILRYVQSERWLIYLPGVKHEIKLQCEMWM